MQTASEFQTDMRDEAIVARRMQRGDAVGEGWLYGYLAVRLLATGLVDGETMRRYRSAAYFARKHAYGVDKATAWEDERKDAHDKARAIFRASAEGLAA